MKPAIRITFVESGGFGGLRKGFEGTAADLPRSAWAGLKAALELRPAKGVTACARDAICHHLIIDDGKKKHDLLFDEMTLPRELAPLVRFLSQKAKPFTGRRLCHIVPPFILEKMAVSPDPHVRRFALANLSASADARAVRRTLAALPAMSAIPSPEARKHRLIYDAQNRDTLPGRLVRSEGGRPLKDPAANEAYDHSGATYDFYSKFFGRNSLDDRGMSLISSVHVGSGYNNAFWNGEQMAYGDGDGKVFVRFTKSLDVVGHELSHGVVTHTANLDYEDEPGALNEHFADVMGILVKQWRKKQGVKKADWLVGADILVQTATRRALRSFAAPGTAFRDDPDIGSDPQPAHIRDIYKGPEDYGGVHINSGIPNHAFYLAALGIGGCAWEKTGLIWYQTLLALTPRSRFKDAAQASCQKAGLLYGNGGRERKAVQAAWKKVGIAPQ